MGVFLILLATQAIISRATSALVNKLVEASDTEIYAETTYLITLSLDSPTDFPKDYRIEVDFPEEVKLLTTPGSPPEVCQLNHVFGDRTDIIISTVYDPSNGSTTGCGVLSTNTLVVVLPDDMTLGVKVTIGDVENPHSVVDMDDIEAFKIRIYNTTNDLVLSDEFRGLDLTEGPLTFVDFQQSSAAVAGISDYTIEFTAQHDIPAGGKLKVTFSDSFDLPSQSNMEIEVSVGSTTYSSPSFEVAELSITIDNCFSQGLLASSQLLISIKIDYVINPSFVGTAPIDVYTMTSEGYHIDKMTINEGASEPCTITEGLEFSTNPLVNMQNTQSLLLSIGAITPDSGYFTLEYPSAFTFLPETNCEALSGISTNTPLSCTQDGTVLTSTLIVQTGNTIALNVLNIINPPNNKTTSFYKMTTYTSSHNVVCTNQELTTFTATPNELTVEESSRNSQYVGDSGPYKLKFTLATEMPAGSVIRINIPLDQVLVDTTVECHLVRDSITNPTNACTEVDSLLSTHISFEMTEWCSQSSAPCPPGSTLEMLLEGVKNHMWAETGISSTIQIYTFNPSKTGTIDMVESGVSFTPNLEPKPFETCTVSRTGDLVATAAEFNFRFIPVNDYVENSQFVFIFQSDTLYNSAMECINSASTGDNLGTPQCEILTLHSDDSIKEIAIKNMCINRCQSGQAVDITIKNVTNPISVAPISLPIQVIAQTPDGYAIESGDAEASLNDLVPGTLTNLVISRSIDKIQSSIHIDIYIDHPTEIPSDGVISLTVPENVLIPDDEDQVSVSRISDDASLEIETLTSLTSILQLKINNYCSTLCGKGETIGFRINGLKTAEVVESISGTITFTSSLDGNSIDEGSFEASDYLNQLTPGTLFDVDIHPYNPTVSETTSYRLIFTSEHTIPAGSFLEISFPTGVPSTVACRTYLTIEDTLSCSFTNNVLTVTNGFSQDYQGSHMIGLWVDYIANGPDAKEYDPVEISILSSEGNLINTNSGTFQLYTLETSCSSPCEFCSGSSSLCYSCELPGSSPLLKDLTCVADCPVGTFLVESDYTCISCHYTCGSCLSEKASECTSCATGYVQSDGYCVSSCPSGTILEGSECKNTGSCSSNCEECSTSADFCLDCPSSGTIVLYAEGGECLEEVMDSHNCPAGFFQSGTRCEECFYECLECNEEATACTQCKTIYGKDYLNKIDNTCVAECPTGITVIDEDNKTCETCHVSCLTCSGTSDSQCETCPASKYLTDTAQCVDECPADTYHYKAPDDTLLCIDTCFADHYIDSDTRSCLQCQDMCESCSNADTCDTCPQDLYWTSEGECVAQCDSSYYLYTMNNEKKCFKDECPTGTITFDSDPNTCIIPEDCPDVGYYQTDKHCTECPQGCNTCTETECQTCLDGFLSSYGTCVDACPADQYEYNGACYLVCPDQTYHTSDMNNGKKECSDDCPDGFFAATVSTADPSDNEWHCYACDLSCATCDGPSSTDCITCDLTSANKYYDISSRSCKTSCESDFLLDDTCVAVCPALHMEDAQNGNTCVDSCDSGYFNDNSFCRVCDSSCGECDGSSSTDCTSCTTGYLTDSGECKDTCDDFELGDMCYSTCPSGTFGYIDECVSECPSGMFGDNALCQDCDSSCAECSSLDTCTECASNLYFFQGQCLDNCPEDYRSENGACILDCTQSVCQVCQASNLSFCSSCMDGYILFQGSCLTSCPSGYYQQSNSCYECKETCKECSSEEECTACEGSLNLHESSCLEECPAELEARNNVCQEPCEVPCSTCVNFTTDQCTSCLPAYPYLHNSYCYDVCPEGYYGESESCKPCDESCLTCSNATECLTCPSYSYLNPDGTCTTECSEGYEMSTEENICMVIPTQEVSGDEGVDAYAVYALLAQGLVLGILLIITRLHRPDTFNSKPNTLFLMSTLEFTQRLLLCIFLWVEQGPLVSVMVAVVAAALIGAFMVSVIFHILHFSTLVETSGVVEEYVESHKWSFRVIKFCSYLFGVHFIRVLYSGFFGCSIATNGKMISQVNGFRTPLERLSFYHLVMINVPLMIHHILLLSLYEVETNSWQIACFGLPFNIAFSVYFFIDWYRGPWRT